MAEAKETKQLEPSPHRDDTIPSSNDHQPPPDAVAPSTNKTPPTNNALTNSDPPKRMISLKHVKTTEPAKPAADNYSSPHERKRVFLPETDSKQDFPLSVTMQLSTEQLQEAVLDSFKWKSEKLNSKTRMRDAGWCEAPLVDKLWEQKSRMDSLFDDGQGFIYRQVRDMICPLDSKGSQVYWNRAGDKLQEVYDCIPFFGNLQRPVEFFDVCGGPGAWSQFLLERLPRGSKGFGITIRTKDTPKSDVWYSELVNDSRFTALYGEDKTGDVYKPENIADIVSRVQNVAMVVADGGFKIEKDENTGEHLENLQELYSARIILSELLIGIRTLAKGGSFVCKLFDCFSDFTVSLLFLVCTLFRDVHIVKPPHSRRVNSERYLVANGFLEEGDQKEEKGSKEEGKRSKEERKGSKEEGKGSKEGEKEQTRKVEEAEGQERKEGDENENEKEKAKEKEKGGKVEDEKRDETEEEGETQEEEKTIKKGIEGEKEDNSEKLELVVKLLERVHKEGFTYETSISSLVPVEWLKNDIQFAKSITLMCTELSARQTEALEVVMDEVDVQRSSKSTGKRKYGRDTRDRDFPERDRGRYWNEGDRARDRERDKRERRDDRDSRGRERRDEREDTDRRRDRDREDRDREERRDREDKRREGTRDNERKRDREDRDTEDRDREDRNREDRNREEKRGREEDRRSKRQKEDF